jgi:hypothetical protein
MLVRMAGSEIAVWVYVDLVLFAILVVLSFVEYHDAFIADLFRFFYLLAA